MERPTIGGHSTRRMTDAFSNWIIVRHLSVNNLLSFFGITKRSKLLFSFVLSVLCVMLLLLFDFFLIFRLLYFFVHTRTLAYLYTHKHTHTHAYTLTFFFTSFRDSHTHRYWWWYTHIYLLFVVSFCCFFFFFFFCSTWTTLVQNLVSLSCCCWWCYEWKLRKNTWLPARPLRLSQLFSEVVFWGFSVSWRFWRW